MRKLLDEMRRRHVWRVAIGSLAIAWLVIQVLETLLPIFDLPETRVRWVVFVVGFVPVIAISWAFEWTPSCSRSR